jgi:hypothetical protein
MSPRHAVHQRLWSVQLAPGPETEKLARLPALSAALGLCAVRLGGGVVGCRRYMWRMRCWTKAANGPEATD